MDFKTAFEKLKTEIKAADPAKLNGNFAIQITMTDEDCGGTFYVSFFEGTLAAEPYDYRDNTAAIKLSRTDLRRLLSGRAKADTLINAGKMEVCGKLQALISLIEAMPGTPEEAAPERKAKKPLASAAIEGMTAKSGGKATSQIL